MFGWAKRRKTEAMKREAIEIGNRVVERVNSTLAYWRENDLENRRSMMDQFFAERMATLEPTEEMSFEMLAEIEALALTKNWHEGAEKYASEFMSMLDEEDVECIRLLGVEDELQKHVWRNIQEVTNLLDEDVNRTIAEALARRGESPTS